jgi:hypothetical protein
VQVKSAGDMRNFEADKARDEVDTSYKSTGQFSELLMKGNARGRARVRPVGSDGGPLSEDDQPRGLTLIKSSLKSSDVSPVDRTAGFEPQLRVRLRVRVLSAYATGWPSAPERFSKSL